MENFLVEHWKLFCGVIAGAVGVGVVIAVYLRDGLRKWLFNGNGGVMISCPLAAKGGTPLSKEEHDTGCNNRWKSHEKASEGRWVFNAAIAEKDREMILKEIEHLKLGQEKQNKTLEKIFDRLESVRSLG